MWLIKKSERNVGKEKKKDKGRGGYLDVFWHHGVDFFVETPVPPHVGAKDGSADLRRKNS